MNKQKHEESSVGTVDQPKVQWILLRGLAREARHWGVLPQELIEKYSSELGYNIRVDCLDLPGSGRFSEMKSPISISEISEFMRDKYLELRQRQRMGGEEPATETYLLAVSLGGMIASDWIDRWPEDFAGCVLVNTSFKGVSPFYKRLSPWALVPLLKALVSPNAKDLETNILNLISNRPELQSQVLELWTHIAETRPVSIENFFRQLLAAARFEPSLRVPLMPVLILNSLQDRMVSASCSEQIAKRWNADFQQHPTAGHDLPLDDSPWMVDEILKWYKTVRL